MINREQIHRTLLEIYFLSFMYTLVPCSYYFSEDKYLSFKLSTLWFVFWLILREIRVCTILYFFFINLSNIVCVLGSRGARKVEAKDYQKLFTNSLVLVFILPKFASIGIFCGSKSVMTVFIPGYRQSETCHAPSDRRFYLSLLWKSHGMFVKYRKQGRNELVKRKPCRRSLLFRVWP